MKNCPYCGKQIDEFCGFCPYCMSRIARVRVIQRTTKKAGAGIRSLTAVALLLIIAVISAVSLFVNYGSTEENAHIPDMVQVSENPSEPPESITEESPEPMGAEPITSAEPEPQSEEPEIKGTVSLLVWGKEMQPGAVFGSGEAFYTEITVLFNGEPTSDFVLEAGYPDKLDWTKSDDGKLLIRDADGIVRCPFEVSCFGVSANYIWDSIGPDNPMTNKMDTIKLKFLEYTVLPTAGFGGGGLETYYVTVMMGNEEVTDFAAYVDDPSVCNVGKSEDGRMTVTNVNGGITKLYVTVGDVTEMFEWNGGGALSNESRSITVELYGKIAPAGGGFGTDLPGEHGVTVMLDGQVISDYTFEIADASVCTAYKAEDGKLMVTNVGVGETKLSITSGQNSAEFIWFCGAKR